MQSLEENQSETITMPVAHVTCPGCGLLCDDLTINRNDATMLQVSKNACAKAVEFFQQPQVETGPLIYAQPASLEDAIKKAATLLKQSNQPLIAGLGTEVQGMRAVMQLADTVGATLDHMNTASTMRNTLVVQNAGWMVTTLTEVRNRVDLLLIIGTDIVSYNSRFFERQVWNQETLFGQDTSEREVVYLGGRNLDTSHGVSPAGKQPTVIECDLDRLPEVTAALRALVAGKPLHAAEVAGISMDSLKALAERLHKAKYSVVSWISSALNFPHAELTVQNLTETVIKLNEKTRSSGLPLGGSEGDYSVNQVSTWISGYPVRNSYRRGHPEYDPYQNTGDRLLDNGEADCMLWISCFNASKQPPASNTPLIVIGHPAMKPDRTPDVFIPVGIPGLDHGGTMFRIDSSVTLPLTKLRESKLPTLQEVILAIESATQLEMQHAD